MAIYFLWQVVDWVGVLVLFGWKGVEASVVCLLVSELD